MIAGKEVGRSYFGGDHGGLFHAPAENRDEHGETAAVGQLHHHAALLGEQLLLRGPYAGDGDRPPVDADQGGNGGLFADHVQ